MSSNLDLCERFFAAVQAGDLETVRSIYAPDAVIWHNDDGLEVGPEQNLRVLGWVTRNIKDLRYEEVRRHDTGTGFIEQHVLRGIAPNGTALEIPACIICEVKDGKVTRLDEYLDSAHTAPLRG